MVKTKVEEEKRRNGNQDEEEERAVGERSKTKAIDTVKQPTCRKMTVASLI